MGQYPVATTSENGKTIQFILEDGTNNKDLNVVHHINLDSGQDAVLGKMIVHDRTKIGDAAFIAECQRYDVDPNANTDLLVVFEYIYIDPDPPRPYKIVKTFPVNQPYYFVPGKPKVLGAAIGPSDNSKTGGEAL
jgi:hypothetical protein